MAKLFVAAQTGFNRHDGDAGFHEASEIIRGPVPARSA
jgi:hypothetical protein